MATATLDTITDIKYIQRRRNADGDITYNIVKSNNDKQDISATLWNSIGYNFKMHLYETWTQWKVFATGDAWHKAKYVEKKRFLIGTDGAPKGKVKTWLLNRDDTLGASGAPYEGIGIGKLSNADLTTIDDAFPLGNQPMKVINQQSETWAVVDHNQVNKLKGKWLNAVQYTGVISPWLRQTGGAPGDANSWNNPFDTWSLIGVNSVDEDSELQLSLTTPDTVNVGTEITFGLAPLGGSDFKKGDIVGKLKRITFTKTGEITTINVGIKRDRATEGAERFVIAPQGIAKDGGCNKLKVTINDTSDDADIENTGTWALDADSTINEDQEFTVTMQTPDDIADGTQVSYDIRGIKAKDLVDGSSYGGMTGNFIKGTGDTITFKTKRDLLTEGNETLKIRLGAPANIQKVITIVDTSDDSDVLPDFDVIVDQGKFALNGVSQSNIHAWNRKQLAAANGPITRTFDISDESMQDHFLKFSVLPDGKWSGTYTNPWDLAQNKPTAYEHNVTRTGEPGDPGATVSIIIDEHTPQLYYYCQVHAGMGGQLHDVNLVPGTLVVKSGPDVIDTVSDFQQGVQSTIKIQTKNGNWSQDYDNSVFTGQPGGKQVFVVPVYDWLVDGTSLGGSVDSSGISQWFKDWDPQVGDAEIKGQVRLVNDGFDGVVKVHDRTIERTYSLQTIQDPVDTGDTGDTGGGDLLNPVVTVANGKYLINGQSDFDFAAFGAAIDTANSGMPPGSWVDVIFDVSDSSNSGHPLRFSVFENGRMVSDNSQYNQNVWQYGVSTNGTAGTDGATVTLQIYPDSTPELFYYCGNHMNMGGKLYNVDLVIGQVTTHYDPSGNLYNSSSVGEWNAAPLIENHEFTKGDMAYIAVRAANSNWEADDPGALGTNGRRVWVSPYYDYFLKVDESDSQNDAAISSSGGFHANRHPGAIADDNWDQDQSGTYTTPAGTGRYLLNSGVISSGGLVASPTGFNVPSGSPTYSHMTTQLTIKKNPHAATEAYKTEAATSKTVPITYETVDSASHEIHSVRVDVESRGQSSVPSITVSENDVAELGDWKPQQISWSYPYENGASQNCTIKISTEDGTQIYTQQKFAMAGDGVDMFYGLYSMDTDSMLSNATNNWHSGKFNVAIEGYTDGNLTDTFSFSFLKLEATYRWDLVDACKHADDNPSGVRVAKLDGNGRLRLKLRIPDGTVDAFVTYTEPDESAYADWETGDRTYGSSQLRWHTSEASGGGSQSEYSWNGDLTVISNSSWMGSGKTWVLFGYAWDINSSDYSDLYQQPGFSDGELPVDATQFNDTISKTLAGGFKLELRT